MALPAAFEGADVAGPGGGGGGAATWRRRWARQRWRGLRGSGGLLRQRSVALAAAGAAAAAAVALGTAGGPPPPPSPWPAAGTPAAAAVAVECREASRAAGPPWCFATKVGSATAVGEEEEKEEEPWKHEDPVLHTSVGLLASITLLPSLFALTQTPRTARRVWPVLDNFLAIFLAVAWFQALDEVMDYFVGSVRAEGRATLALNSGFAAAVHGGALYALWLLRRRGESLAVVGGTLAHLVSFSAIKTAADAQEAFFTTSAWHSTGFCLVVMLVVAAVLAAKWKLLNRRFVNKEEESCDEWVEVSDDLDWDAAGMTLAIVLTQAAHHVICGDFDAIEEPVMSHSRRDVLAFLGYSFALMVLFALVAPLLDREVHNTAWWVFNLAHVARNVLVMMVAWSYLLVLKWVLLEGYLLSLQCSEMFAALILAFVASGLLMVAIRVLPSEWSVRARPRKRLTCLVLQSLSLVCAWSWEELLDEAIDALAEQGLPRVGFKLFIAALITAVITPVHVQHIHPKVEQCHGGDE